MIQRFCQSLPALLLLVVFAGCSTKPQPVRVLWPPPPQEPKVEFIGTYASEQDFPKTEMGKLSSTVLGDSPLYTFKAPFGIAADGKGLVYVSDLYLKNVRVYDFNRKTVEFLTKEPLFRTPMGLAVDAAGQVYVADGAAQKIWIFGPDRQLRRTIGDSKLFTNPIFLALNERLGRLYVADSRGQQVVVFDLGGNFLFSFGKEEGESRFGAPLGLAIDKEDRVFVADRLNARIEVFDADGHFLRLFGARGDRFDQFEAPRDLAFDRDDNLWVADQRRSAIYTYQPDGRILLVTGGDTRSTNSLAFASPSAIYIDPNDRIYVADMLNRRFSVWQYLTPAYLKEHPVSAEDVKRIEEAIRENLEKEKAKQGK